MLKLLLLKNRKKISWILTFFSLVVILSGYGLTIFTIQNPSFRSAHFIIGAVFAFVFFLHMSISVYLIRFDWKKTAASIINGKVSFVALLRFFQIISGWFLFIFSGFMLLSGLGWLKLGTDKYIPFSTHIWIDYLFELTFILHIVIGLRFAIARRKIKQIKKSEEKPISFSRREAIIYFASTILSVLAFTYLDRLSIVNRTIETIKNVLPPGQYSVSQMKILHIGSVPSFEEDSWNLIVDGLVKQPLSFTYEEFKALPKITSVSDFHCVTRWTKFSNTWEGVSFNTIIKLAKPLSNAKYALILTDQEYSTSLPITELIRDDVLLAYRLDNEDLPLVHGGPVRLVVPHKYAYKSAKWVRRIKFIEEHELGYWEARGYSDAADPFTEDRYSKNRPYTAN